MTPDLVVLGNLLVDDVVLPDGRTRMAQPGGACLYAALAAALWQTTVGVVSWRGLEYPETALEALRARGVALDGVRPLGRPGLRTWLLYEGARRRVVHRLEGPSHAEVSPRFEQIPPEWHRARAFLLAPMPFDVQRGLVEALSRREGALVCLDPYALLTPETRAEWSAVLPLVDVLFLSEDEMELAAGADDPRPALEALAGGRLRWIVFKRGVAGGLLYDAHARRWRAWAARAEEVVDPTGAGDAFAAGLLAGWLAGENEDAALQRAVVSASFAIEAWGPAGLLAATPGRVRARGESWSR